jgi:aryl-alcohol dehydrogenase-like predicted oxidoreductase
MDTSGTFTMLPENAYTNLTSDLKICRVLNGMWQVSGAHGKIDKSKALEAMVRYHDAGFTTWDLADHYGPAEDFIGAFRQYMEKNRGSTALEEIQAFTKWVPRPGPMPFKMVETAIETSLRRMKVDSLDLLQFHWWDYGLPAYLDALDHMMILKDSGKIKNIALTNFDTAHVEEIVDHGIPVLSNQVQFSIIDRRPERRMIPVFETRGIKILAYGTLCGGLLSGRYLGASEPGNHELDTASLQKYKRMIDAWGGWPLFQELLAILSSIAEKHGTSIANVATRYILEKPAVAGIIVGARLGIADHHEDNAPVFGFSLDPEDNDLIEQVSSKSRDLLAIIGDCGDEYR